MLMLVFGVIVEVRVGVRVEFRVRLELWLGVGIRVWLRVRSRVWVRVGDRIGLKQWLLWILVDTLPILNINIPPSGSSGNPSKGFALSSAQVVGEPSSKRSITAMEVGAIIGSTCKSIRYANHNLVQCSKKEKWIFIQWTGTLK